ncbi:proteasome 26S subunit [Thecamonas trahens ATCC 50062]|uniref:Proteasome 26S subunit n=1 Tax=Thecamonas trahens ATCC 50062 TaxID=461836 RepID=A0A0L0DJJ8_THETB|nr:proteasome 26S subunit [Thecamonas trahens ATCC 50062]KNC52569.1 proteasome 26S subunit [Thecamonas trahens ATCC 50062]|eukprot:XP_013755359.1 proteasome 26S subunit [Thecamonas trahens ATCC 50062]
MLPGNAGGDGSGLVVPVPDMVLCSPFRRAALTGHVVAKTIGVAMGVEMGLTEWLTPSLVGGPGSQVPVVYSPFSARDHYDGVWQAADAESDGFEPLTTIDVGYASVDAPQFPETEGELVTRAQRVLDALMVRGVVGKGRCVVIVSHAPVLLALAMCLEGSAGVPGSSALQPYPLGGVTHFSSPAPELGVWTLHSNGYTGHLSGEARNGIQRWTLPCLQGAGVPMSRAELAALYDERSALEASMAALASTLTGEGGPGLSGNLVDSNGFPRDDIDVVTVRQTRNTLARMKTDHRALSKRIEDGVFALMAAGSSSAGGREDGKGKAEAEARASVAGEDARESGPLAATAGLAPIAVVNSVADNSPAAAAGLCVGDAIVSIGDIDARNWGGAMGPIGSLVANSEGKALTVVVERGSKSLALELVPGRWAGRGLLGCHIVPY